MDYQKLAKDIIEKVGTRENINGLTHCITRLRFDLKDDSKAKTDEIKKLDGVIDVIKNGAEYQVVIGTKVDKVYAQILELEKIGDGAVNKNEIKEKNKVSAFLQLIMQIFSPILSVLAASGMIKGFLALAAVLKWMPRDSGEYILLSAVGDSLFYFLPIILGYTAAKKFGVKEIIGMTLGGVLIYPTLLQLMTKDAIFTMFQGTAFESPVFLTFFGIPVILQRYASSVIPIILTVYVASIIQKWLNRIVPSVVKSFLVPLLTLLIVAPLALLIIGPVAYILQKLLGLFVNSLIGLNPGIAGFFIGTFWSVLVMFGLHWGIIPLITVNLSNFGYDIINPLIFTGAPATVGAVLAVILKTKDNKVKNIAIPAMISSICGVNEPAMYGVLIPRKKIFITTLVSAGIGAAICGFSGAKLYTFTASGPLGLPGFINPAGIDGGFIGLVIGGIVSTILAFISAYMLMNEKEERLIAEGRVE